MPMHATALTPFAQALQQFLRLEDAHLQQLEDVETQLTKKLRFQSAVAATRSRTSLAPLLERVELCRFTDALAQLQHLHRVFGARVSALAAVGSNDVDMEASIVDALDEMLQAVRFQYAQLVCHADATQTAFEHVLSASASDSYDLQSVAVLQRFLATAGLSVAELVMRPLQRFYTIVDFVEELSPLCRDTALAPRLLQLALDSRHYIHDAQADARDEHELMALQTQLEPTTALATLDLSTDRLLLRGEVRVAMLRATGDAMDAGRTESLFAHCFQSGALVYSKPVARVGNSSSAAAVSFERFVVHGSLELKRDPVFLECVPDAVLQHSVASGGGGALALVSRQESVVLAFDDASVAHQWRETVASLLTQNEARTRVLRSERSFSDVTIPPEAAKQLKCTKRRNSLVAFPSFQDDDLPGLFWLERDSAADTTWELVELMFFDHWLLISKVVGWKHHTLLHHFDCRGSTLEIREAPSGGNDWGLELSFAHDAALRLKLVSKRRSRVDFWFDEILKAVARTAHDAAAAPVAVNSLSAVAARSDDAPAPSARTKKSKSASSRTVDSEQTTAAPEAPPTAKKSSKKRKTGEREPPSAGATTAAATTDTEDAGAPLKIDSFVYAAHETFEGGDAGDDRMPVSKPKKSRKEPVSSNLSVDTAPRMQSPAIKTPKRRWLKLKEEDPEDAILLDTDISQDTVESTMRTSQSQNAPSSVRIILTGMELTPAVRKKIKAVGGAAYEDDIERATHVVAPKSQLKRTVKLLCGISRCDHIVDEKWLDDSARAGAPLSEQDYCLLDTAAQTKWHFDLHKTMYEVAPMQRRQLFAGHTVFITNHKSVLPPVKDLVKIVECAGGHAETKGSASATDLVISTEAALAVASVQKALAAADPQRIYSPELILTSILQQHIAFDKNRLELPASRKRR